MRNEGALGVVALAVAAYFAWVWFGKRSGGTTAGQALYGYTRMLTAEQGDLGGYVATDWAGTAVDDYQIPEVPLQTLDNLPEY